jgi:LCP family protein required for cell wall assembly
LLQKIINENFGIKTEYYALINYAAVRSTVDALGGITVTIKSSEPEGLYDPNFRPVEGGPLKLANGPQNLDGQTALNLTRARGATYGSYGFPQSDFNRSQHQQLVFAAMKEKLSWKLLLNPRKNGAVFESVATNVKTDIQASEVMPLYRLMKRIPDASLRQINLRDFNGVNLLASYRTPYGQSALIPAAGISNYNQIKAAVTSLNH